MNYKAVLILPISVFLFACSNHVGVNNKLDWMYHNSQTKTVVFDLVAGRDGHNNAYNYNGFYAGNVTLKVPDGWNVEVNLSNRDGNAPHNIIVTFPYSKDEMPDFISSDAADIKRAYTEDVFYGEQESMHFVAKEGKRRGAKAD